MTVPTDSMRIYVRAALELQGYEFTEERIGEITLQFARIEAMASSMLSPALADTATPDLGPAPVFRP